MSPDDPRHGTYNGYINLDCRCSRCREAHTAYCAGQRDGRRRRGVPDGDPRHGKYTTYCNWRCRCPECTAAWTAYRAAARQAAAS